MMTGASGKLALVDTLERPWALTAVKPGTLVLVEFMTSTCVPCKKAIPILKDLQSRYGASGLQLAGVMCDDLPQKDRVVTAAKYRDNYQLNYAVYVEPGTAGSVRDRFGVESYPTAILLDSTGRVLWKGHPGKRAELEAAIKRNLGK
jgi:thiol-disulfide isomerase/thioredoxin